MKNKKYQVLIAEDDFRVANIWKEFTQTVSEFEVCGEVRSGEEALAFLDKKKVDLLIMDVYMPDIDGIQLLSEIRHRKLPLEVVTITAAKESEVVQRITRMGVIDYIIKPCVLQRFQKALKRFVGVRELFDKSELEQNELDQVLHGDISLSQEERKLPKGMQELTMKKVQACFEKNPYARSAEEITKTTGLSLATVQRYLRYLADNDLIKKELTYGSQGRPEHKYSKV